MKIHLQYIAKTLQDKLLIYRIDMSKNKLKSTSRNQFHHSKLIKLKQGLIN